MIGSAIGAIGGIAGALLSGSAADSAADAQLAATHAASAVTRENFLDSLNLIQPQILMGDRARNVLAYEMGIGELPFFTPDDLTRQREEDQALSVVAVPGGPVYETGLGDNNPPILTGFDVEKFMVGDQEFLTRESADDYLAQLLAQRESDPSEGFAYQGFRATPGYDFRVSEGQKAVERSAAARGMTASGATMKELDRFGQGIASQEYGNYLNRLAAMSGSGQVATGQAFQGYQNQGNALSNLALQGGNARASSYIGRGNAYNAGIGNVLGSFGMFSGNTGFGMGPGMITG